MKTRIFLLAVVASLLSTAVQAQMAAGPAAADVQVRVYPVQDLIVQVPNYTYKESGPSREVSQLPTRSTGGAMMNGYGQYMSNPGGMSMGSGMEGLGQGNYGDAGGHRAEPPVPRSPIERLAQTISNSVEPQSWNTVGGPGAIEIYDSSLVVLQSAAVHEKIAELLTMLRESGATAKTVCLEARWLLLDSSQLDMLFAGTNDVSEAAQITPRIDPVALKELTRSASSYRGQITCFSGQRVFLVAGERRNLVISVVPVVGAERSVGYQPVTITPNIGVLLEGSATLIPGAGEALLDVTSTVTAGPTDEATWKVPDATSSLAGIDRYALPTQQLSATLRVPLDVPVLVGGMTALPNQSPTGSLDREQMYLIVRVTEVK